MEIICVRKTEKKQMKWTGKITKCKGNKEKCEFELQSRGSYYHVIIGEHN